MLEFRKKGPLRTMLVWSLCAALISLVYPKSSMAGGGLVPGAGTSDEAGAPDLKGALDNGFGLDVWRPSPAFFFGGAAADTTDLEFPDDEAEDRKHLVRDIGIFIVVSAFLAFFLVKVFLEGDEESPPPDDDGKEIPGASRVSPTAQRVW